MGEYVDMCVRGSLACREGGSGPSPRVSHSFGRVTSVREQGYDNGRATPDGFIVVAVFAMVMVSVTWDGVAVAL